MHWQTTRFSIDLARPQVMGIVNVTPDSFSDGGRYSSTRAAMAHCEQLLADGADMLDLGGESSRPGSPPVPLDEELARVLPVLRDAVKLGVPISVDTYKPQVMCAALAEGTGDSGAPGSGDGPGGERLYNPDWFRKPTDTELATYLPKRNPGEGWGAIACRTIENHRVEDCQILGESPGGSGYGRAVLNAAWQFQVIPPRVNAKPQIGVWVRIKITYSERGARAG